MITKTTAKTVTQLTEMTTFADNPLSTWMEASKLEDSGKYSSRKFRYDTLRREICDYTDKFVGDKYRLSSSQKTANVLGMDASINNILSGNTSFGGEKYFSEVPKTRTVDLDTDSTVADQSMANLGMVRQMIEKHGTQYSTGSRVQRNPIRYSSSNTVNGSVYDENSFYYWHIDDRQKDSSKWYDDEMSQQASDVIIQESGMLTIYGWLADTGTVKAQESWVGLFAKIRIESQEGENQYVPIQIQPWIQGQKHQILQYVGFNVPVSKGMEIKIMTGFPVNGSNSGLNDGDCLMFKDVNMPNTFIGYVIVNNL